MGTDRVPPRNLCPCFKCFVCCWGTRVEEVEHIGIHIHGGDG